MTPTIGRHILPGRKTRTFLQSKPYAKFQNPTTPRRSHRSSTWQVAFGNLLYRKTLRFVKASVSKLSLQSPFVIMQKMSSPICFSELVGKLTSEKLNIEFKEIVNYLQRSFPIFSLQLKTKELNCDRSLLHLFQSFSKKAIRSRLSRRHST